jgi:hypothetical protein
LNKASDLSSNEKPKACSLCHRRFKRGNEQNRLYWLLLHTVSERLPVKDSIYSSEQWHHYFRSRFLGCDDMMLPNGKVLAIPKSTADLDVAEFAEYFDRVQAWAGEHNIWLEEI